MTTRTKGVPATAVTKPRARNVSKASPAVKSVRAAENTGAVAPRRTRRVEARNAAILDAALNLFSRLGLHGATVDQIAAAAGISKTNLFYYFASKEDVYVAVLRRLLDAWLAPLRAIEIDLDPIEAIRGYIRSKVEFSRSSPDASRLFCLEIVHGAPFIGVELKTSLKELVDAKATIIQAWISEGRIAPVDPYDLIFAIWSTTQHYADFAEQVFGVVGKRLSDDAFCEQVIASLQHIIVAGIGPRLKKERHPRPPRTAPLP